MSDIDYDNILNFTVDLAVRAGELIKKKRDSQDLSVEYKDHMEAVTSADIAADDLIRTEINKHFPEHSIFSEESSPDFSFQQDTNKLLWIVDPIDGTVNYAHNLSQVCISIAFAVDGVVKVGVVHAPFQNETFIAIKGKGAFLGCGLQAAGYSKTMTDKSGYKKIVCNTNTNPKTAIIATGFPYDRSGLEHLIRRLSNIMMNFQDIRRFGSAALDICWTACGRFDGYCETIHPWDLAAACLIAKEAGCYVDNLYSSKSSNVPKDLRGDDLVVAPPGIYPELAKVLEEADSIL